MIFRTHHRHAVHLLLCCDYRHWSDCSYSTLFHRSNLFSETIRIFTRQSIFNLFFSVFRPGFSSQSPWDAWDEEGRRRSSILCSEEVSDQREHPIAYGNLSLKFASKLARVSVKRSCTVKWAIMKYNISAKIHSKMEAFLRRSATSLVLSWSSVSLLSSSILSTPMSLLVSDTTDFDSSPPPCTISGWICEQLTA